MALLCSTLLVFDPVDLSPATRAVAALLPGIDPGRLDGATPTGYTVGTVLDHLNGLAYAFTLAARKQLGAATATAPNPSAANLPPDWADSMPDRLAALAEAWADPAAWDGMTQVGGVTLPGAICGRVALNEVVLHGWDLAVGTGQPYHVEPAVLEASLASIWAMYPADELEKRQGIFGPPVEVGPDASLVDRTVAASGRDPGWSATGQPAPG
jgi:uncharacterized protein (TIGR03086 family)